MNQIRILTVISILLFSIFIMYPPLGNLQEIPLQKSLNTLPETVGSWKQADKMTLNGKIVDMLGVDNYEEIAYTSPGRGTIDFYVSYFKVLKEGKQFHSPKNCLIGSGSRLLKTDVVRIPLEYEKESVPVGFMMLQHGDHKQLILYWFQCRGRIMYSEYEERIYRVMDAVLKKRTDGAFIRIIAIADNDKDIQNTKASLIEFASMIMPALKQTIPGS